MPSAPSASSASAALSRKFPRLAFVDLETTGGAATEDRITEIGIIEVDEDGVREWSSLVNPQVSIPGFIQSLTGITDEMVRDAPLFSEVAKRVAQRLSDRLFIAHNARFDYGFLKNEFRRVGHEFRPPVLCTVRLSRKLFPGFSRHGLDALVERHRLEVTDRHRALGDARLIWQFWQRVHEEHPDGHQADQLHETIAKLVSRPTVPSRLDSLQVDALPNTHGVYLFYGENDLPLYIGKANHLRRRVLQHFSGDHMSSREQRLSQQVERITWEETAGEVGALLLEATLIKRMLPAYNQLLRDSREIRSWRLVNRKGRLVPVQADTDDLFFSDDPDLYGLFESARKATEALKSIADEHHLCHVLLGLEKGRAGKPCFACQAGKCHGACTGRESVEAHNKRVRDALQPLHLQPWPYGGPVGIREGDTLHVVDGWAWLGSARTPEDIEALLRKGRQRFDKDVYQILQMRLAELADQVQVL